MGIGSKHGRGRESGLAISVRLDVMKSAVIPAVMSFSRTRSWDKGQIEKLQRVANYAVRRAFGTDIVNMKEHHVSDAMMYKAAGWERDDYQGLAGLDGPRSPHAGAQKA